MNIKTGLYFASVLVIFEQCSARSYPVRGDLDTALNIMLRHAGSEDESASDARHELPLGLRQNHIDRDIFEEATRRPTTAYPPLPRWIQNDEPRTGYGYTRDSLEFFEAKRGKITTVRRKAPKSQAKNEEGNDTVQENYAENRLREGNIEFPDASHTEQTNSFAISKKDELDILQNDEINPLFDTSVDGFREIGDEGELSDEDGGGGGDEEDLSNDEGGVGGGEDTGDESEDCGPDCRNLLHELGHPKEDSRCPSPEMVIDVWGYCRYIFHEERRDWNYWENVRNFVLTHQGRGPYG